MRSSSSARSHGGCINPAMSQVKPLTCVAHHRDRANPRDIGTNDAMGEFSLTAIDSLSTMVVMAASSDVEAQRFWEVVEELARIYW
jgi:hypothetical protein